MLSLAYARAYIDELHRAAERDRATSTAKRRMFGRTKSR